MGRSLLENVGNKEKFLKNVSKSAKKNIEIAEIIIGNPEGSEYKDIFESIICLAENDFTTFATDSSIKDETDSDIEAYKLIRCYDRTTYKILFCVYLTSKTNSYIKVTASKIDKVNTSILKCKKAERAFKAKTMTDEQVERYKLTHIEGIDYRIKDGKFEKCTSLKIYFDNHFSLIEAMKIISEQLAA